MVVLQRHLTHEVVPTLEDDVLEGLHDTPALLEELQDSYHKTYETVYSRRELNSRAKAPQQVEALMPVLCGKHFDKFKRSLQRSETYTYLDRLHSRIEALPVAAEEWEAVMGSEGAGQNSQLVEGDGRQQGVMLGSLVV
jgi:hypothetical protein